MTTHKATPTLFSFVSELEMQHKAQIESLMNIEIKMLDAPEALVVSDKLIDLEIPKEVMPVGYYKENQLKSFGGAFHEKAPANKKVNKKVDFEALMKKKYKKQYRKKNAR